MIKKDGLWNKISVVLVNYNGEKIIENCLSSLLDNCTLDLEIMVIDNASADNSMALVESKYESVHTIYLSENLGWGAGCNIGFKEAFSRGAEYVLLLNTDTEIESGMIETLLKYSDEKTITVPRMFSGLNDRKEFLWYSGGSIDLEKAISVQTVYPEDELENHYVTFATGCCMLIHKNIWETVGGFDEDFFLYYEDTDYCLRLVRQGLKILYVPSASLWHKVGGSSDGEISYISQYYTVRNRLLFVEKNEKSLNTVPIAVLGDILYERTYFATPFDRKYRNIVEAAIRDYLQKAKGKERNYLHENYTVLSGFYELEEDEEHKWQWSGEHAAEIEVRNSELFEGILEFSADLLVDESVVKRNIEVYWNGDLRCLVTAPLEHFCVQGRVKPGEKAVVCFRTSDLIKVQEHERQLMFAISDAKVKIRKNCSYTSVSGFYGSEEAEGRSWQWSGERVSEIEVVNRGGSGGVTELTGSLTLEEGEESRKVRVYWNGEPRGEVTAPCESFCVQGELGAGERARIRFEAQEREGASREGRRLEYCLGGVEVRQLKGREYLSVSGFYGSEEAEGRSWQWSGGQEAEIEVKCDNDNPVTLEISFDLILPEELGERILDIYWNGEYRSSVTIPLENFYLQGRKDPEEKVIIKFVSREIRITENVGRAITFGISDFRLKEIPYCGAEIIDGAYPSEQCEDGVFYWISKPQMDLRIRNGSDSPRRLRISMILLPPPGRDTVNVKVNIDGNEFFFGTGEICIELPLCKFNEKTVHFTAIEEAVTNFNGDPRVFYYQIRNINVN